MRYSKILFTRREFLRTTATALGTISSLATNHLGAASTGKVPKPACFLDTNVWLGLWPFRRLPSEGITSLAAKLRRHHVTRALAASFDAVFGPAAASNAALARACRGSQQNLFIPFGTINPKSRGWKDELRLCKEEYRMPGLRLVPNYHGYKLEEPEFAELVDLASEHKLLVQLVLEIEDERVQRAPPRGPVDARPLVGLLKSRKAVRLMLLNWHRALNPELRKELAATGSLFDIASVEGVGGVAALMGQIPERQIVFGSNAPFFYFEAARQKLQEAALTAEQMNWICCENAQQWQAEVPRDH